VAKHCKISGLTQIEYVPASLDPIMIDKFPKWPRSNYPDFNTKNFDYSGDTNINSYIRTANQIWGNISEFNSDKLSLGEITSLVDKICLSKTIHEGTVCSDILWGAYNSYEDILKAIQSRLMNADQETKEI
jgi:hypothetical protein